MNATIEDALALADPVEVGQAFYQAALYELRLIDRSDRPLGSAECAKWLHASAPELTRDGWAKLVHGLIAYAEATDNQSNEVREMLTPITAVYFRYRHPDSLTREVEQWAAAERAAKRIAPDEAIGALLDDLNSGRFTPSNFACRRRSRRKWTTKLETRAQSKNPPEMGE